MYRLGILGALVLLLASFVACADRSEVRDVPESEEALESVPPAGEAPDGEGVMPRGPEADDPLDVAEVEVVLKDFAIEMPELIPATFTRFLVRNEGAVEHSLRVTGQGTEAQLLEPVPPGGLATLEADLDVGVYEVVCPLEDHAQKGMQRELTVGEPVE